MKSNYFLAALLLFLNCKENESTTETHQLGEVDLSVTGKKEALPSFQKGLLLLHSFEYEDAREAFKEAQEIDPNFPMAYWGEAMTHNHSLWSEQDYSEGAAALSKLDSIAESPTLSEVESDFISAAKILYKPQTPKSERDVAYANFMAQLYEKHPDNNEIASFYALSLLGSAKERDTGIYEKGALIAKSVIEENPNHPGALHYLIHSYDDPGHAQMALNAANSYSQVAPDASHALHMPSHIYVALGMWDEVVSSNEDSYQASLNRMERKKLSNNARGYHAFHWLEYGYLQQGRIEDAKKLVNDMHTYVTETPSPRARAHMVFLKSTYLAETKDFDDEITDIKVDVSGLNISTRSQYNFLDGYKAYYDNNVAKLDSITALIEEDIKSEEVLAQNLDGGFSVCSSATREFPSTLNIQQSQVMVLELKALSAMLKKDKILTEQYFKEALDLQSKTSYSYGPPDVAMPPSNLYADWLASENRNTEALEMYEYTLKRAPNHTNTIKAMEMVQGRL
ncbi:hypothetical protein [Aegicerativicinus sediminis]